MYPTLLYSSSLLLDWNSFYKPFDHLNPNLHLWTPWNCLHGILKRRRTVRDFLISTLVKYSLEKMNTSFQ